MMKNKIVMIILPLAVLAIMVACKPKAQRDAETAEAMISARSLGLAYLEENQLEEAETEFLKLVKLDPDEVMGYANLGIVYLRMGEYKKAEEWLQKAIQMDPEDPDVRLILAKVYEMSGRPDQAMDELEKILGFSPGHVKTLYNLTEIHAASRDPGSLRQRLEYTSRLVESAPGNIVPRLNLVEILIRMGEADRALEQVEELPRIFPEFPKEAVDYFGSARNALLKGDTDAASAPFMIFHNYLKVTSPYQAGMMDLKGPGGSLVGSPVITFNEQPAGFQTIDWETALAAIKFTDISSSAGLEFLAAGKRQEGTGGAGNSFVAAADYDLDGDVDLYAGHFDPLSNTYRQSLLNNEWGIFKDVSARAGIDHSGPELTAGFFDYDNDGYLDLYVVREGPNILYRNNGDGTFTDVTGASGAGDPSPANHVVFFDYDHDGDLDIYLSRTGSNLLYRNNADGTFEEQTERSGLSGGEADSRQAAIGDFDDDGDIDLFVVNRDAPCLLFSNQRQGIFRDMADQAGITTGVGTSAVSVGDYNNDGFLDIFVGSMQPGESRLFRNAGDGTFRVDEEQEEMMRELQHVSIHDATLFDFDNDGYLDLLVSGESEGTIPGVLLYHNDITGKLWPSPGILPETLTSGRGIETFDYNEDGDLDITITGTEGDIRLFRNDGGNNHHYIKMKLVGLRAGSAKNNHYGIGAKVEVRSGNLYQSMVVTEPEIHMGLGPRAKAEVIRILWTNGVPQNIFFPETNQNLIEEQILKGSCPFLYTWNGEEFVFLKDIMWRSALGMPLGIMGGETEYGPPEASSDYIRIPGDMLKEKDGAYVVQITGELWETLYMDRIGLIALDHPDSVDLFVDERLAPPPGPGYRLYQVTEKLLPVSATDHLGRDLLPLISEQDDRYVAGFGSGHFQGITEMSEIILDPGQVDPSENLYLFLTGWIFPTDASINASMAQSDRYQLLSPVVEVVDTRGRWIVVEELSFPMGKDKTLVADLTGRINPSDPRVRIRTNIHVCWDRIFFASGDPQAPVIARELEKASADLHYRGFSRPYRRGGRYGPHWFDYSVVNEAQMWRDLTGYYTRFGDVLPLLEEADNMYVIKNAGDETTVTFSLEGLDPLPEGWKRDFLIHSVGWVKDGDLNTAAGQTVEPLPFHGMSRYPYGPDEAYPSGPEYEQYRKEYNTRKVDTRAFQSALREQEPISGSGR